MVEGMDEFDESVCRLAALNLKMICMCRTIDEVDRTHKLFWGKKGILKQAQDVIANSIKADLVNG